MKRSLLHICFWAVYFLQNVLLIFFVNTSRFAGPSYHQLLLAAQNCLVLLLPKIFFTYIILYRAMSHIAARGLRPGSVLYLTGGLLVTVFLYRALALYGIEPYIYNWSSHQTVFYPLGILVAVMDIGFVSGTAYMIRQTRLGWAAKLREEELAREKLEAELRFLRSQTNPHFLFNTLNNIYALARRKAESTPEVVLKLSQLLRFMLYETARDRIRIDEEIAVLDHYIELENIRYNSRLTVNFYRELDNGEELISPLLLLPFVENAFKHGAGESHLESYIHIDLVLKEGQLRFEVENTREENAKPGGQLGLRNVRRQLELTYSDHDLQVHEDASVFKVTLSINLTSYEKNKLSHTGR